MELRLLHKNKEKTIASFLLKNVSPAYANTLRRLVIEEVPTLAIERVEFANNSSALYDEIVAHRLGLLVLSTDMKSYNLPSECKCKGEGCAQCTLNMTLSVKGPKTVYASDIKTKDPKVKPVYPKTPIVKLLDGQELKFSATAVMGQGKEHTKWSPGLAYYRRKAQIELGKNPGEPNKIVDSCPVHVFEVKNNKLLINKDNAINCHMCKACEAATKNNDVTVTEAPDEYIFTVEGWGQLTYIDILKSAMQRFNMQLDDFQEKIKNLK